MGGCGYILAGGGWWWVVVDIFWLVVGGGVSKLNIVIHFNQLK